MPYNTEANKGDTMDNLAYFTWEDENGPHIHFYDEFSEDVLDLLMELGLVIEVDDDKSPELVPIPMG